MKLVIGISILLALANNKVHGGVIGNYEGVGDAQGGELHNDYGQAQLQAGVDGHYGDQEQGGYGGNEVVNHEARINQEALVLHQGGEGGDLGRHPLQWQGGFQASEGIEGGVGEDHAASDHLGVVNGYGDSGHFAGHGFEGASQLGEHGIGQLHGYSAGHLGDNGLSGHSLDLGGIASHGINLGGHDIGGGEHIDLKPKVEVQHHHIPTKTIEQTKAVHIPVVKKIGVPVPHPVGVPTAQVIKVPIPQPYAVHVPVPHPIAVPIYKLVPQEIEKKVPIEVEKLVPVYVDKPYKVEVEKHHLEYVDKPYPVHVPVYKHIYHHVSKHHGSGAHSEGHKGW